MESIIYLKRVAGSGKTMTLLRKDSILSVLVVGILLVGSTFAFLPAFAASSATANTSFLRVARSPVAYSPPSAITKLQ